MTTHKWQFAPRFRRSAFGWRSDLPVKRIKEALAEIRQVARKQPPPEKILRDLVASTPGAEGKRFAAAKDAGLFAMAIELVTHSPADPRTLTRAARDYADRQPGFALAAGLAALQWISRGHGYEITGGDVIDAYSAVTQAAVGAGVSAQDINGQIWAMTTDTEPGNGFVRMILGDHLSR